MFAWTRTFYAKKDGIYYNFDAKRNRDDTVRNHGFEKAQAIEAYKHYKNIVRVPWRTYEQWIKENR